MFHLYISAINWLVEYCQSSFRNFLELALAFKFLSNADLVLQLHFLERSVPCDLDCHFGTLAFYLFGKITLPHDSPMNHISVGRLYLGLVVLAFTVYLIPEFGEHH
jgi:thiol:disulfide interchange protein DsbD